MSKHMRAGEKIKRITAMVFDHVAGTYVYIFSIYLVCLILSVFSQTFSAFFNWTAFHLSVITFSVLTIVNNISKKKNHGFFFGPAQGEKWTYLKALMAGAIAATLLYQTMNALLCLSVGLGLISFLFRISSRVAAGIALLTFITGAVFLFEDSITFAESLVLIAYFFAIFTMLIQLAEKATELSTPDR